METITEKCTGCRTCEKSCPKTSITMVCDDEGFIMPSINQETCIDCKICQKRCPQNNYDQWHVPKNVYAVRDKDDKEIYRSASGGAFAVIARYALTELDAVVYGASYVDEDLHVGHIAVKNISELYRLQSSKYVQSNTLETYEEVKHYLSQGVKVLYSGTPCQIAGLKSYLNKDYDNLLTVDLICHGVPSPLLFEKYMVWLSSKMTKVIEYDFRDKSGGWGLSYKVKSKGQIRGKSGLSDPYYYHFLKGNIYRECCYECRYCRKERVSDITIGDYWGIEKEHPHFFSTKGVSCVLLNTEKGQDAFKHIRNYMYVQESTFEQVARHNENLYYPTKRPLVRDAIYKGIKEKNAIDFYKENMAFPVSMKSRIKALAPTSIKKFIRKIKKA